ncbi:hypothetical protein [Sphingobacterium mizutaii]|uniref:hypothetical protein n=1 Tax=Sphingobacterium mizutaii TaxID=1010 RepID=UPI00289EA1EC|nr:hypothetical protein [Sphingobacterium mizutaii]
MTVAELKQKIADLPDHMDVMIMQEDDDYGYSGAFTAEVRDVTFKAPEIPKKEWAVEKCLVITDEL